MAPFQRVNIILGHRTKKTCSLGFSFQTDVDTNDHRIYQVEPYAQPCGIRAGDFIVGLNHQPLPSTQSHTSLAEKIKTICRPFTLNVLRPQEIMVDERPKLRQQHRDWFVAFCRKYRVERSVIEATLRLRRATICAGQSDKRTIPIPYTGSGRNEEHGHDGDMTSLAAKRHLIVCLRVMVKFIDDRMGVTSLSALAGFKLSDDAWMALEFEVCNQVNWNLVYFCHSSKNTVARVSPTTVAVNTADNCEHTDPFALIHNHQQSSFNQPLPRTVSVEYEVEHYWDIQDQECARDPHRERDFWEPITPPRREEYKRKRADTITPPTSTSHNGDPKRRPSKDQTVNPIHHLAKAKAYTQNKQRQQSRQPQSIPVLTLGPGSGGGGCSSSSGSDNSSSESDNENVHPNPASSSHHPGRQKVIHKVHHSQISHCTNTTQEQPQRPIPYYATSKVAPKAQYHPSQYATTCVLHNAYSGHEVMSVVANSNNRHPQAQQQHQSQAPRYASHKSNPHQQKRYVQQLHHQQQHRQHQLQHQHEKSRTSIHAQSQQGQHPGFLTMFRARCQSIVNSINRTPQVAAP